jgi:tight adherence protein B
MNTISENMIWLLALLGIVMVGALALRMIFAPENRQERAAAERIRGTQSEAERHAAQVVILKQGQNTVGRSWPMIGNPQQLIQRAEMEGEEPKIIIGFVIGSILLSVLLMLKLGGVLALPLGFILGAFITVKFLRHKHQKRIDALTQQLPDALDLMMRGLRVGHPIGATIANVGRTMPDPIGAEFRILAEQISHGDFISDAFNDMADRLGQEDVEYLAVAINIQHGTGGNLADVLGTLSTVVRERIIMRRRVRAISSEGRMSAYVLSALPVLIYISTSLSAPGYYTDVSDDPMFKPIMLIIVGLVVGNFLALRKLVTFKL